MNGDQHMPPQAKELIDVDHQVERLLRAPVTGIEEFRKLRARQAALRAVVARQRWESQPRDA